jgi:hypothetical protein
MKLVKCVKKGSELKVEVLEGKGNVQFPKDIREDGKVFAVENLEKQGNFWKAKGSIFELIPVGTKSKKSGTKKIMEIYSDEERAGETDFFFEGNILIGIIDGNDGNYRSEYMNCLFEHFGVEVKHIKKLSKEQESVFVKYCNEYNIGLSDDETSEEDSEDQDNNEEDEDNQIVEKSNAKLDYIEFIESNDHEGETWSFFVKKDTKHAKELLEAVKRYKVLDEEDSNMGEYDFKMVSAQTVKTLMERDSDTGYMDRFNLVKSIIHPSKTDKKFKNFNDLKTLDDFADYMYKARPFSC